MTAVGAPRPGEAPAAPALGAPPRDAWGALLFLYSRTATNRLRAQLARLRSPRYVLALLLGVGYLYLALWRPQGGDEAFRASPLARRTATDWIAFGYALFILSPWVFTMRWSQLALAFSPAEVHLLFPAPLTRRALVHAKLLKAQATILLNVVLFTVLLRGDLGAAAPWMRAVGLYLVFATQTLHGMGAALTRTALVQHRGSAARRMRWPLVLLVAWGALMAAAVIGALPALRAGAADGDLIGAFGTMLRSTPARIALFPARLLIAPLFADDVLGWLRALPAALLVPALHYLWVVRTDVAFEEAAADASTRLARMAERRRAGALGSGAEAPRRTARFPSLAATGRPEVAIIWKNIAAAVRVGGLGWQLAIFGGGLVVMGVLLVAIGGESGDVLVGIGAAWLAMLFLIGPVWTRFDLRLDLPRLAILRSWPLSGTRIVASMITCTTLLHVGLVWTLLALLVALALWTDFGGFSTPGVLRGALLIALAVPPVSALMFAVQNAAAMLFPAWVRTGAQQRGLEAIGQNLLTMGATLALVLLGLVYPVLGAIATALWAWRPLGGSWALVPAFLVAGLIVLVQLVPVVRALGALFDRTEPREVAGEG